jgi:hypothetical protein
MAITIVRLVSFEVESLFCRNALSAKVSESTSPIANRDNSVNEVCSYDLDDRVTFPVWADFHLRPRTPPDS